MPKEFRNFGLKNEQTKKDTISLDENKIRRSSCGTDKSGLESDTQTKFPIPVLLTCPHGGIVKLSPKRDSSNFPANCHFSEDSDLLTIHITESIALNISTLFEKEVYRNVALVHRRFVDFNRDAVCAYENSNDTRAEKIYNEYHDGILEKIKKCMR